MSRVAKRFALVFVAFRILEPFQDRHHGVVSAAGTARGWGRVVEPLRGLCVHGWRRELRLLGRGLAGDRLDPVNPIFWALRGRGQGEALYEVMSVV